MFDSLTALPRIVQQLLDQRDSHSKVLAEIEATLTRVNAALASGIPVKVSRTTSVTTPSAKLPKARSKTKAAGNGQTANEFVLDFVKANKSPTSQQINAAWKASGRNRTADINLSLLTKAKKLKRTPLGLGIRGSTYSIAE